MASVSGVVFEQDHNPGLSPQSISVGSKLSSLSWAAWAAVAKTARSGWHKQKHIRLPVLEAARVMAWPGSQPELSHWFAEGSLVACPHLTEREKGRGEGDQSECTNLGRTCSPQQDLVLPEQLSLPHPFLILHFLSAQLLDDQICFSCVSTKQQEVVSEGVSPPCKLTLCGFVWHRRSPCCTCLCPGSWGVFLASLSWWQPVKCQ